MSLRAHAATFGLNAEEFDRVVTELGREPNEVEAAMFGALWSEHCGYKNSRPLLRRLPTEGPQVLQGPGENAGVVDIGDGWAVAFKMESHNHPSAVEPVQGAATGVGGILRDIFAMGARPVAILDALRFGPPDDPRARHLLSGVVEGISSYGNAIGVPTVGGEIEFHPCYDENPLVNVMALGLLRHERLQSGTVGEPGNALIYLGSATGRDGLGGAVFASADLSAASDADRPAVQVGDPFLEKLLLEATLDVIDRDLVVGVQDMGAAGLTSSVAEMAHRAGRGVDLDLDAVPRRESGMTPLEVMLSESQERMLLTTTPERVDALLAALRAWELDAVVIGEVADHDRLRLHLGGERVADLPVEAINDAPTYTRAGRPDPVAAAAAARDPAAAPPPAADWDPAPDLMALLAHPSVASKRPVFERYDHMVMTNTVVPPGVADAAVLRVKGSRRGVAATVDCTARYVWLDPYLGAAHAVAEAARNLACVGATPLGVTDNLNFGNPYIPEVYHQLERAVDGLRDACLALGTPVTGGNVSLYNQYRVAATDPGAGGGGASKTDAPEAGAIEAGATRTRAIHPTPTVGMVGVLPDVTRHATAALRREGDRIWLVGTTRDELGGSLYAAQRNGGEHGRPPALDLGAAARLVAAVAEVIQRGICDAAHDLSDGGLAVALAEMCLAGGERALGATVDLTAVTGSEGTLRADALLFGESAPRVLLAAPPEREAELEATLEAAGVPYHAVGTAGGPLLRIVTANSAPLEVPLGALRAAHESPLQEALA